MTFLTLADVKRSPVKRIVGVCPSSTEFSDIINEATERLMTRGDWATTVVPIHTCIKNGCVTFPRYVGHVRKMAACGVPVPITGMFSPYLDRRQAGGWFDWPGTHTWNNLSGYYGNGRNLNFSSCSANVTGYYPSYSDPWDNRYIRAYCQYPQDFGKTVTIFGRNEDGQPLATKNTASDGTVTYAPGAKITLGAITLDGKKFGSTSMRVQAPFDRIIKDETEGRVWLYGYNDTDDLLEDLAVYEPKETNPTYVRMRVPGAKSGGSCSSSSCSTAVMAIVKLQFIPAVNDEDLVLIPNTAALKTMVQAILFEDSLDAQQANDFEVRAIRELNLQLRDIVPEDQTGVSIEAFNGSSVGFQKMF
jgi:hypothetical protein